MKNTAQLLVVIIAASALSLSLALLLSLAGMLDQAKGPGFIVALTFLLMAAIGHLTKEAWGWLAD
ncbi:hypothetical protein [Macrococcus bovicus]|uniref:hypothetical protein n=1 Tax=Macrococcus bovicus TaxID=69968 RepID=UPI0025A5E1D7|nr:hypothetical protein [Macrococcus bovicus]WJP97101.1 hypothetical protein QSV55_07390 [Macrococcus bovicus]